MKNFNHINILLNFKVLLIFCSILFNSQLHAQNEKFDISKKRDFGLVWGLLKYHHTKISNGDYNWDEEFLNQFDKLDKIQNQNEMNIFLYDFILKYDISCISPKNSKDENLFYKNYDYTWINESIYGIDLTNLLNKIKDNQKINNYYASTNMIARMLSFKNEKGIENFNSSKSSHRLLFLFNFWNAIQYWNVNKYLMRNDWLNSLDSMIFEFENCKSDLDFEIAKTHLIAKLNDSHSYFVSKKVYDTDFKYKPVFEVKSVNDSLLITAIYNKSLAKIDNIELGDIITKIEGVSVKKCYDEKILPIISSSNTNFIKKFGNWLLFNNVDTIKVEILKKNNLISSQYIKLYNYFNDEEPSYLWSIKKEKFFYPKNNIAYVNLENINKQELKSFFKEIIDTKGLIIDLRNYPKSIDIGDLTNFLYPDKKEFIKVLFPLEKFPSISEYDGKAPVEKFLNPFVTGKNNPKYYKGKVVLLVNKITQSKAEYFAMAIQQSPNCYTIGEQTAGSVMNITSYIMSDKTEINFTGLGAFYPDGVEAQVNGIKIDYNVKESAINFNPNLYIEEAVKFIEN